MANKKNEFKQQILANLPKGFKCNISKSGLHIYLYKDNGFTEENELAVKKLCKKFKFDEVGAGTNLLTGVRDWDLIVLSVEQTMKTEAKDVLKAMKSFFNRWGNAYCESSGTYDIVEQMRNLIATDEV